MLWPCRQHLRASSGRSFTAAISSAQYQGRTQRTLDLLLIHQGLFLSSQSRRSFLETTTTQRPPPKWRSCENTSVASLGSTDPTTLTLMLDGPARSWVSLKNCRSTIRMGLAESSPFTPSTTRLKVAAAKETRRENAIQETEFIVNSEDRDITGNVGISRLAEVAVTSVNT